MDRVGFSQADLFKNILQDLQRNRSAGSKVSWHEFYITASMALKEYQKKRSQAATPEPFGGEAAGAKLEFVVQKHAASRLHYDFRLEVGGVLKSWAIPKGPSMDSSIRHLAMMVEDHPYDYKDFEGIIPQGQYGGGTVIIWDQGFYEPLEPARSKKEQEKIMERSVDEGSIKIRMFGRKLKGEFALVRTKGMGDNAWLIIKHKDEYADSEDITLKDKSVISKKTIDQMARDKKAMQWISNHAAKAESKASPKPAKKSSSKKTPGKSVTASPNKKKKPTTKK
jgi:bifunctional non-homologous end joining protein LigD